MTELEFRNALPQQFQENELLNFNQKAFSLSTSGFSNNEDPEEKYRSQKFVDTTEIVKIHQNCVIVGSNKVIGSKQPKQFSFALDKPPGS